MPISSGDVVAGVALDLAFGDPQWMPHPVRAIGRLAEWSESFCRHSPLRAKYAGGFLWLTVVATTAVVVRALPALNVYWIYSFLACRDLDLHGRRVISALESRDPAEARRRLSWMVGRDTEHLEEDEIVRATIESVAENLSDGVIAPLFYLAIGGPTAMAAYKAINTLDSMVGHMDERYRDLGFFSARVDDYANFLPARISAALIWCSSLLLSGCSAAKSLKVTLRDGSSQPSPNAGYPEAAIAGALGCQLGGLNFYDGVPCPKATLGDPDLPLDRNTYSKVRRLLYLSELIFVALIVGRKWRRT